MASPGRGRVSSRTKQRNDRELKWKVQRGKGFFLLPENDTFLGASSMNEEEEEVEGGKGMSWKTWKPHRSHR